ncbi:MAG: hypothetical protein ABIS49_03270 [Aestuariivirga sp.]
MALRPIRILRWKKNWGKARLVLLPLWSPHFTPSCQRRLASSFPVVKQEESWTPACAGVTEFGVETSFTINTGNAAILNPAVILVSH